MLEPLNPPAIRVAQAVALVAGLKEPDVPAGFHVGQMMILEDVQVASG